jgi:hypothetical protein
MYKVTVLAAGESSYCGNGMTFETVDKAKQYGADLFSRWTAVRFWRVEDSQGNVIFSTEK